MRNTVPPLPQPCKDSETCEVHIPANADKDLSKRGVLPATRWSVFNLGDGGRQNQDLADCHEEIGSAEKCWDVFGNRRSWSYK